MATTTTPPPSGRRLRDDGRGNHPTTRSGKIQINNNRREVGPLQASTPGPLQVATTTVCERDPQGRRLPAACVVAAGARNPDLGAGRAARREADCRRPDVAGALSLDIPERARDSRFGIDLDPAWQAAAGWLAGGQLCARDDGGGRSLRATRIASEAASYVVPELNSWLRHGYAVVRTDYEGLGVPGGRFPT